MSSTPMEFHFSYPFLNSSRRNLGSRMLYRDQYQAYAATPMTTLPLSSGAGPLPPAGGIPATGTIAPPIGGGQVGPPRPQGAAIPMLPPAPPAKAGILDSIKQHKMLVIGLVVALILIIAIIYLIFRKKRKGRRR